MRPSQPEDYIHSSMVIFNKDSELGTQHVLGWDTWKEQIDKFLGKDYKNHQLEECPPNQPLVPNAPACRFNLAKLGACGTSVDNYGYSLGKPCLYFKLNRIFGVTNEPYNGTADFPADMPEDLQQHILKVPNKNQVWVNCQGENPADVESMGPVRYFPADRGFPGQYFPYLNQRMYESPLVAVQFLNPKIGQLLHVECRAWAKNIRYHRMDRIGMVHFELFVLDNKTAKLYEKSLK
jgi:sodium/potassium-transporting ATPase subunit beta